MDIENPADNYDALLEEQGQALGDAILQARAELSALNDAASTADKLTHDASTEFSIHTVDGVGRYAVVRKTGWRPLLKVIHNAAANIDFSANTYPTFDAVIGENFPSPYLLDPLHDKFESFRHLRDNISAVRNFLMETYYVNTPDGMTPEKANQALKEIAKYIGQGLDNNKAYFGLIPTHDHDAPFISIAEASATGGAGAQYIYEKVLAMHRQSNWTRPFAAVLALFGGKAPPDWMLPPGSETEFTDLLEHDIIRDTAIANMPTQAQMEASAAKVGELEAARQQVIDRHQINVLATDLDALSNHLLASAANMQNVAQLSEPVRRDAIDLAKDILNKLKVSLGAVNVLDGLKLPPSEELKLGSLKGVSLVYERLVAWGRGIDPGIMQDPSVLAATRALGQMGYLAKLEALRMAKAAGNSQMAESLSGQLARIPEAFATITDSNKSFGALLDKVERGIDTLVNRLQAITGPGAKVGFSAANELGSYMNSAPIAGSAMQSSTVVTPRDNDALMKQNALNVAAQNNLARKQSATVHQQTTRDNDAPRTQPRPSIGRPATQQPKTQQRATVSSTNTTRPITNPTNMSPAQQQAMRNNALHHAHEHEEAEHQLQLKQVMDAQRIIANQKAAMKAAAKAAMQKIDPHLLHGFQAATNTHGLVGPAVNPGGKKVFSVGQHVEASTHVASVKNKQVPAQPGTIQDNEHQPFVPIPPGRGGGRGF